jgi:hypothetical protein
MNREISLGQAYALAKARWGNGARAGYLDGVFWVGRYYPTPPLKITGASFADACLNAGLLS